MEGEGFLRSGHANRQVGVPASRWAGAYASRWARVYVRRNIRSGERALLQRVRGGKYEESEHEGRRMRGNEHEAGALTRKVQGFSVHEDKKVPNGNEKVVLAWLSRAYQRRRISLTARLLDAVSSLSGITSPYENVENFFARLFRTTRRRGWYHSALFCPESSRKPASREASIRGERKMCMIRRAFGGEGRMHIIGRAFGASERRAHAAGIRSGRGAHNAAGAQGERKVRITAAFTRGERGAHTVADVQNGRDAYTAAGVRNG